MQRRDPHLIDEQYDGVLSALALSGGVAALPQLGTWLGSQTAARALVQTAVKRRLGSRISLPGDRAEGLVLRRTTMRILTGRTASGAVLEVARFTAVHRFEYHIREGRPLHPTGWVEPDLFARTTLRHPEAADAMWRSLSRLASLFVDLDPEGGRLVVVDRGYVGRQYRRLIDALAVVAGLIGQPVALRVLAGASTHAERLEQVISEITQGGTVPWVVWDVKNLKTGAWFAEPARADGWSDSAPPPAVEGLADQPEPSPSAESS